MSKSQPPGAEWLDEALEWEYYQIPANSPLELLPKGTQMSPFPMDMIGNVCLVEVLPDNMKGGVILPSGEHNRSISACKVIRSGEGELVATGERVPQRCKEGDLIICLSGTLAKIDHGVRGHLVERGVPREYIEDLAMIQYENVLAVLPPLPEAAAEKTCAEGEVDESE